MRLRSPHGEHIALAPIDTPNLAEEIMRLTFVVGHRPAEPMVKADCGPLRPKMGMEQRLRLIRAPGLFELVH